MDNRDRIMECALDLFYAKGYDAVGVQEIVERAGITKPTLYHYFGSKYGLLKSLLDERLAEFIEQLCRVAQHEGDVPETLYRVAGSLAELAYANRKMYMLMMALFYSARENEAFQAIDPWMTKLFQVIVNVFEQAAWQLGNMNGRQEQFALSFLGVINQYILHMCGRGDGWIMDRDAIVSIVNQFIYGINS